MSGFVAKVEDALRRELTGAAAAPDDTPSVLLEAARHLSLAERAKRARPRLIHNFGEMLGIAEDDLVDIAVAAEMMHAASLLHDDVIDEGIERRGLITVNERWSNTVAVLGGDMLLCLALLRLHDHPVEITRDSVDTVARMTAAVMKEVECRRRSTPASLEEWREIAEGKTGALLSWCGRATARLAGTPDDVVDDCGELGMRLGVAFQLADDLLDFAPEQTGKTGFADLKNANPSHPIAWACTHDPAVASSVIRLAEHHGEPLHQEAVLAVAGRILSSGAMEAGLATIREEMEAVEQRLDRHAGAGRDAQTVRTWMRRLLERVDDEQMHRTTRR